MWIRSLPLFFDVECGDRVVGCDLLSILSHGSRCQGVGRDVVAALVWVPTVRGAGNIVLGSTLISFIVVSVGLV